VRTDQIGVVDVAVLQVAVRLHLRLNRLNDLAFAEILVGYLDPGDFEEGLGECLRADPESC
jgi:hypothetical protein